MAPETGLVFPIQQAHVSATGWTITLAAHSHCPPLHQLDRQVVWLCNANLPQAPVQQGVLQSATLLTAEAPEQLPQWQLHVLVPPSLNDPSASDALDRPFPDCVTFPTAEHCQAYLSEIHTAHTPPDELWRFQDVVLGNPKDLHGQLLILSGNALGIKRQLLLNLIPLLRDRWLIVDTTGQLAHGFYPVTRYHESSLPIARFGLLPLLGAITQGWPAAAQTALLEAINQLAVMPETLGECLQAVSETGPHWLKDTPLLAEEQERPTSAEPIALHFECLHNGCIALDLSALRPNLQRVILDQLQHHCTHLAAQGASVHVVWHHPDATTTAWLIQHAQNGDGLAVATQPLSPAPYTANCGSNTVDVRYLWPLENLSLDPILDNDGNHHDSLPPPHDVGLLAVGGFTHHLPLQAHLGGHQTQQDYALDLPQLPVPALTPITLPTQRIQLPLNPSSALPAHPSLETGRLYSEHLAEGGFTLADDNSADDPLHAFETPIDLGAAFLPDTTEGIVHTQPINSTEPEPPNAHDAYSAYDTPVTDVSNDPFDFSFMDTDQDSEPEPSSRSAVAVLPPPQAARFVPDDFDVSTDPEPPTLLNDEEDPLGEGFDVSIEPPETTELSAPYSSNTPQASARQAAYIASPESPAQEMSVAFHKGQRVLHPRYGSGTIQHLLTTGGRMTLRVQFDTVGKRLLDAEQSNLTPA